MMDQTDNDHDKDKSNGSSTVSWSKMDDIGFKVEAMMEQLKSLQKQQDDIVSELQNMKVFLGDDYKGKELEVHDEVKVNGTMDTMDGMKAVKEWLVNDCKM